MSEAPSDQARATTRLSPEHRRTLLQVARGAIEARLSGRRFDSGGVPDALRQPVGVFVTLRRRSDGDLRGCIGYLEPRLPLVEAVARAAVAAAVEDTRFDPVTLSELEALAIEVSVLGPLAPIRPADVSIGIHGLVIRHRGHSGLLLPQVATENRWDATTLLERTCWKAGLPPQSWREAGCQLLGFTAEVFGEEDSSS